MAQLSVWNLAPELVLRLKLRAAQHGRSMEAEHREILRQAPLTPEPDITLKALLFAMLQWETIRISPGFRSKSVRSSCETPPRHQHHSR